MVTAATLIESFIVRLEAERQRIGEVACDAPIIASRTRLLRTVGTLHVYEFTLPQEVRLSVDLPLSIVPPDEGESTEGIVLDQEENTVMVQANDALRPSASTVTLIPDLAGLLSTVASRLKEMITNVDAYRLGPAERLVSLFQTVQGGRHTSTTSSTLTTIWLDDCIRRRQQLAALATELVRENKRILWLSPNHRESDEALAVVARTMKAGGLNHKTWISRYEMPLTSQPGAMDLQEVGFEVQMHHFYARSRSDQDSLRRKYERFRELSPFLAQKEEIQKDLDEVRLLEWRHVTQLRDLQVKIAEVASTLAEYEALPLLRRLGMQAVGKNVESLKQYRVLYQKQADEVNRHIDIAKARIQQLVPEAAVPRNLRAEYDELKEEVIKLGGTKKIRELLAAEADPNRQAFLQNRRLVAATPVRVASDPLFSRVRFDVLLVDEGPRIAAAPLLAAAGLVRERIVLSGDTREIEATGSWATEHSVLLA
jgi:hypothetical protein